MPELAGHSELEAHFVIQNWRAHRVSFVSLLFLAEAQAVSRLGAHLPAYGSTHLPADLVLLGAYDWTLAAKALTVWYSLALFLALGVILPPTGWSV